MPYVFYIHISIEISGNEQKDKFSKFIFKENCFPFQTNLNLIWMNINDINISFISWHFNYSRPDNIIWMDIPKIHRVIWHRNEQIDCNNKHEISPLVSDSKNDIGCILYKTIVVVERFVKKDDFFNIGNLSICCLISNFFYILVVRFTST
jgi:hypothetical protein